MKVRVPFSMILIFGVGFSVFAQTPTSTPVPLSADIAPSGLVDMMDLFVMSEHWNEVTGPEFQVTGDLDGNGKCDARDLFTLLRFWRTIGYPEFPPYIISVPPEEAELGEIYRYHVEAVDPEGSPIVFSLPTSPSGMVISATGFIAWAPSQTGAVTVEVQISDGIHEVTEAWGIHVSRITLEAGVAVSRTNGATVEVTDENSPLYGAHVVIPPDALPEDSTVAIRSATGADMPFFDEAFLVHTEGLENVTGDIEFQVPVSEALLEDVTSEQDIALYVFDASSGEWLIVEEVEFTPASAKDKARNKALAGWVKGRIKKVLKGVRITINKVAAFGKEIVQGLPPVQWATRFWFQTQHFVVHKGSEDDFWRGGERNLLVIHGIFSDAETFRKPGDVADSLKDCYDNILIWQYRSAQPIGAQPDLFEREGLIRSGNLLWKQFASQYVQKSLKALTPKGYEGTTGINTGIPLPSAKSLGWDFKCDMIAHSMGGLVVREMLENGGALTGGGASTGGGGGEKFDRGTGVDQFVDNLVSLATPHNGAIDEQFTTFFLPIFRAVLGYKTGGTSTVILEALATLAPGGIDLINGFYPNLPLHLLARDFVDHLNDDPPTDLHTRYWQVAGESDNWVTTSSALYPLPNTNPSTRKTCLGFGHGEVHEKFAEANGAKDWVTQKLGLSCSNLPGDIITIDLPNLPPGAHPLRLVRIPAGTFQMGSPDTERGRSSSEGPVHTVTLTNDFYIGETEVTQAQWKALMGSNPATDLGFTSYGVGNDYPVYYVSWNDITQGNGFLARLDAQTSDNGFRLPTEAEWEYACRAGTNTRFYFGDSLGCGDEYHDCEAGTLPGNRSDYMWYGFNKSTPTFGTKPVRGKAPNAFGLYDMHGNVWEWCQDWWQADFYSQPGATALNPLCNNSISGYRVLRAGGWNDGAWRCRSTRRDRGAPTLRYDVGVRVVRAVD